MIRFLLLYLTLTLEASLAENAPKQVMVIAMMKAAARGDENEWHMWRYPGHSPMKANAEGRHDIAAPMYPLIGPYDVSDPDYQDYMIHTLRMIGVDVVSLWWPKSSVALTYQGKHTLRDVRQAFAQRLVGTGIHACLRGGFSSEAELSAQLKLLGESQWQIEKRPVITFFVPPKEEVLSIARLLTWKQSQATPPWMLHVLLDATESRYTKAEWADGVYGWVGRVRGNGAQFASGEFGTPPRYYSHLTRSSDAGGLNVQKEWQAVHDRHISDYAPAVSPGFDDREVGAWGQKTKDKRASLTGIERSPGELHRGTDTYRQRWEQVLSRKDTALVVIPTWDDWNEGSQIEPSVEDGVACLEVTRSCIARFKGLSSAASGNVDLTLPSHLYRLRKAAAKAKDDETVTKTFALSAAILAAHDAVDFEIIAKQVEGIISESYPASSITNTRYWSPPGE